MTLPRLASCVFRAVASDVTLTVSAIWPMPSGTSRRAFMSTWSWTFSRTLLLKPLNSIVIVYTPGGSARIW